MNNKNLILTSAAALVAVIAVSGFAFGSFAADTDTATNKADTAVSQERQYGRGMMGKNLSDEQIAELEAKREARRTEMETAINTGYEAWSNLIKEEFGEDAPILDTITADNFARFKEGHSLMLQGREIMEELGVKGNGMGMGMGKARGMMGGGHGRGMGACMNDTTSNVTDAQ